MACNLSAPELRAAYDEYNRDGFEVVSVSIQETVPEVDAFVARYGLDYRFAMDTTAQISTLYEVSSTPTTFFITPAGTIADRTVGVVTGDWLESNIQEHLGT